MELGGIAEPKACGRPEQPPNSTMLAPDFNVGSVVEYSCDEGHLLVGPTMRTCLETGFYNEFPPVCKRKCERFFYETSAKLDFPQEFNVVTQRISPMGNTPW